MSAAAAAGALAALAGVIALVLLARRLVLLLPRRLMPLAMTAPRDAAMSLEQVLALDARRRLLLVRCGERRVLLLTGGTQDVVLGWLETPR